jgi:4a-hydroxytetrahydrobiopterin dehydratase
MATARKTTIPVKKSTKGTKSTKTAKSQPLTKGEQKRIKALGAPWQLNDSSRILTASFAFPRYLDGFMFATRVSVHAEVLNHHPELCITPHEVKVTLTTHSAKRVTELDIELAERINSLLSTRR